MTQQVLPFVARHIGPRVEDERAMLAALGLPSMETLITQAVPASIRLNRALDLPAALSEHAALAELNEIMGRNVVKKSFIGAGYHGVQTPPVIQRNLFENPAGTRLTRLTSRKSARPSGASVPLPDARCRAFRPAGCLCIAAG